MAGRSALEEATERLTEALQTLEELLAAKLEHEETLETLKSEMATLRAEHQRLLNELERQRARAEGLERANDEVHHRLESVVGTIKSIVPVG